MDYENELALESLFASQRSMRALDTNHRSLLLACARGLQRITSVTSALGIRHDNLIPFFPARESSKFSHHFHTNSVSLRTLAFFFFCFSFTTSSFQQFGIIFYSINETRLEIYRTFGDFFRLPLQFKRFPGNSTHRVAWTWRFSLQTFIFSTNKLKHFF